MPPGQAGEGAEPDIQPVLPFLPFRVGCPRKPLTGHPMPRPRHDAPRAPAAGRRRPRPARRPARAAAAVARLDQASAGHPLLPALLHRARLDTVRRQAAADGHLVDPWHLAALAEGLRPRRLDGARSIAEAGGVFEAGRAALALHRWLTTPGLDEEAEIGAALA
jgi:hypothetical protein